MFSEHYLSVQPTKLIIHVLHVYYLLSKIIETTTHTFLGQSLRLFKRFQSKYISTLLFFHNLDLEAVKYIIHKLQLMFVETNLRLN